MAIFRSRNKRAETPSAGTAQGAAPSALTFGELETAIEAAHSQLYSESQAARTLARLAGVFDGPADTPITELPPGPQDVSSEDLDAAIEEAAEVLGARSTTIAVLKEARAFIARAEQAERPAQHVTERIFSIALVSIAYAMERQGRSGGDVGSCLEHIAAADRLTREETASVKRLLKLFEEVGNRAAEARRRNARRTPGQPWSTM